MSNSLRKFKRINVKKYTCRKCKNPMSYKPEYGIWVCQSCGWEKTDEMFEPQESEDKCSNCAKSWTDNCPRNKCWDNDYSEFIKEREVSE